MIEIDGYYDFSTLTDKLQRLAEAEIIELLSIGESVDGRPLWCATVAGTGQSGSPSDQPAVLVTANMHAREYAGSWTTLRLLDRLAEGYGSDQGVTELLDRRTIYAIPRVCPDGAEFVLETRTRNCRSRFVELARSDVRDPNVVVPRDITGDGRILSMRWPAEDGGYVVPDDEPRLTLSRPDDATEGTFYRQTVEGVVANYDGGPVSAANVRCDFNRNFPSEEWAPQHWIGHGAYPLSEPETRALADFVLDRPNIVAAIDLHCGNPAIFYPQGVQGDDPAHPSDADLFRRLGERGEELTGFPYLAGYFEASGGDPYTLQGAYKDWLYERIGIPAYTVEHGMLYNSLGFDTDDLAMDSDEHARATGEALLAYHDDQADEPLFYDWEPVEHPELGQVEVGGWDWAQWSCPAVEDMPDIADRVSDWIVEVAEWAPEPTIEASATPVAEGLHRVEATVRNRGRLPTNITERGKRSIQDAEPVLTLAAGEIVTGRPRQVTGHLDAGGDSHRYEWVVRDEEDVTIALDGARGVSTETTVNLGE